MAQLPSDRAGPFVAASLEDRDIVAAFEGILDLAGEQYDRPPAVDRLGSAGPLTGQDRATVVSYLHTLFDLLERVAPPGTCLDLRPGNDGPSFGFWPPSQTECP
jgi:hypothetical protein